MSFLIAASANFLTHSAAPRTMSKSASPSPPMPTLRNSRPIWEGSSALALSALCSLSLAFAFFVCRWFVWRRVTNSAAPSMFRSKTVLYGGQSAPAIAMRHSLCLSQMFYLQPSLTLRNAASSNSQAKRSFCCARTSVCPPLVLLTQGRPQTP